MANRDDQNFRLIACPHIFSVEKDRIDVQRPAGGTVRDLMKSIGWVSDRLSARVFLDGVLVKDAAWEYTVPRAGQSLVVRAVPMGGQGKDAMRIVAMIGVIAASLLAPYSAPFIAAGIGAGTWGGAAFTAFSSIVGSTKMLDLMPARARR